MVEVKDKQDCMDALLEKFKELSETKKESSRYSEDVMLMVEIYKTLFG